MAILIAILFGAVLGAVILLCAVSFLLRKDKV